jgi:hypothetical protein
VARPAQEWRQRTAHQTRRTKGWRIAVACCAFAAFLISQIIFGLDWARERMGLIDPETAANNAVVAWRLDGAGAAVATRRGRTLREMVGGRLGLAAMGGGGAFVLLAALTLRLEAGTRAWNAFTLICTGHGLERLASLSGG